MSIKKQCIQISCTLLLLLSLGFAPLSFSVSPLDLLQVLGHLYGINVDQLNALQEVKGLNEVLKDLNSKQLSAITGHYRMGALFNTLEDQSERLGKGNWQSVLQAASGGNGARFQELVKHYQGRYRTLSASALNKWHPDNLKVTSYLDSSQTNVAGLSVSEYTYNGLEKRIKTFQHLLNQIEQAPNEKATLDLETRVLVEIGFVQLEMLRLQSVQTQLMATHAQGLTNGITQDAEFVKWGKD